MLLRLSLKYDFANLFLCSFHLYLFISFNDSFSIKIRVSESIESTYRIIIVIYIIKGIVSIENNCFVNTMEQWYEYVTIAE